MFYHRMLWPVHCPMCDTGLMLNLVYRTKSSKLRLSFTWFEMVFESFLDLDKPGKHHVFLECKNCSLDIAPHEFTWQEKHDRENETWIGPDPKENYPKHNVYIPVFDDNGNTKKTYVSYPPLDAWDVLAVINRRTDSVGPSAELAVHIANERKRREKVLRNGWAETQTEHNRILGGP